MSFIDGHVYKLTSRFIDKIYIGSTTKNIFQRLYLHKIRYLKYIRNEENHYTSAYELLCFPDVRIICIQTLANTTKEDLLRAEAKAIRHYKALNLCVNINIPIRERGEYYSENKQKLIEKAKSYYRNNREIVLKNKKEIINCSCCESKSSKNHIVRHQQTRKCKELQDNLKIYNIILFINKNF